MISIALASVPVSSLSAADHPYLLYVAILACVALCSVAGSILRMVKDWSDLRSKKRASDDYATKHELREVHARVDLLMTTFTAEFGRLRGEVMGELRIQREQSDHHRVMVIKDLAAIERSLGRVEGYEHTLKEHGEQLRDLQVSVGESP